MAAVEFGKVVTLQQGVGKFGKGNADVVALDALFDRFFGEHGVHGKMLADVAQEIQAVHAGEPVGVIGHNRGVFAFKAQKGLKLAADFFHPSGHGFAAVQAALLRFEAGVADHAGGAADQGDGSVAGKLEAAQRQHRQQMADVQAVGGGVETAVERDFFAVQQCGQLVDVGGLVNQAACLQLLQ